MLPHNGKTIKILLADDHNVVRQAIKELLQKVSVFDVVAEASSGEEALKLARKHKPDVILMDIKMPGIGGLEATRKLCSYTPNSKIVILTSCDDEIFPQRLLKAGASGYLVKSSHIDEIIKALLSVHAGRPYITPNIANKLAISHIIGQTETPFDLLSSRELQVCLMITRGDRVQDIANRLNISSKTVNSYRYRCFDKLQVHNDVALTRLAIRYRLIEEPLIESAQLAEMTAGDIDDS